MKRVIHKWRTISTVLVTISLLLSVIAKADFIENKGQWPTQVLYAADITGGKLFVEKSRLLYCFYERSNHDHGADMTKEKNVSDYHRENMWVHAYEVRFINSRTNPTVLSEKNPVGPVYNYINGNDPNKWASIAHSFTRVTLSELYPGIDLILFSQESTVKYDLVVRPEGNARNIRMQYNGLDKIVVEDGNLLLETRLGKVTEIKPYTYQVLNGKQKEVSCDFQLRENIISFSFPRGFEKSKTVIIDPNIIFSAYSGSTSDNWGNTATYDNEGNLYSAGIVASNGYPVTLGAYQVSHAGGNWDIGILKYDSAGSRLIYATYLGGNSSETPQSMVVNKAGELLILGTTSSKNFPVTNGSLFAGGVNFTPMDGVPYPNGSDIFVAKLNSAGAELLGSTFLGGSNNDGINFISGAFDTQGMVESPLCKNYGDQFRGDIITDSDNNIYIASNTTSADFPILNTGTTYRGGSHDALVVKLHSDLSAIQWSRFLGGTDTDAAYSIKLDNENNVFVAGGTRSSDFEGVNGFQSSNSGGIDGWIASLSVDGMDIANATYIGTTSYDQAYFVDLNSQGEVYLYGQTKGNYPVSGNVFSQSRGGQFIHKLSKDLKVSLFSTVFGSGGNSPNISPTAFLVSDCNKLYVAGWGGFLNATTVTIGQGPFAQTITRNFVGGNTRGLLVSDDAYQTNTEGDDFYLMVLDEDASAFLYGTFLGGNRSFTHVDGGTSRFDKRGIVYHAVCAGCGGFSDFPSVNAPAGHTQNKAINGSRCSNAAFKFDLALLSAALRTNSVEFDSPGISTLCFPDAIVFENLSSGAKYYEWDLGDGTIITTTNTDPIIHTYQSPGVYHVKLTAFNNETCEGSEVASTVISVFDPEVEVCDDGKICYGSSFQLFATGGASYFWESADGNFTSSLSNPVVSPTDTTLYYVTVTDESGCQVTDSVLVEVVPDVEFSFDIEKEYDCWNRPTVRFKYATTSKEGDYTFTWNFGDGTTSNENPVQHNYAKDSTYVISLSASGEFCTYQSSRELRIKTIKVPNVVTANGDDKNDKLVIDADNIELKIYNRWGKLLFQQGVYQDTWPPASLVPGIYYYHITIERETTCKGWVHVLN